MTNGQGLTSQLADFAADLRIEDLPPKVVHDTKRLICDALSCSIGGTFLDAGKLVVEVASEMGGAPASSIVGTGQRVSPAAAAFANTYLGNVLDADETLHNSGHHSVVALYPALALGEARGISGAQLITAMAAAYDIGARVSHSLLWTRETPDGVESSPQRGMGTFTYAAAVSAAKAIGLDGEQTANAMGVAAWNSPIGNSRRWQSFPSPKPMAKYGPYGFFGQTGVTAAQLAEKGFTGDVWVLDGDGPFPYWQQNGAYGGDLTRLTDELGTRWFVSEASMKPYASGRYANPATDLLRAIVREEDLTPGEIDDVAVSTLEAASNPWFLGCEPKGQIDMQFSIPLALAAAAHRIELAPRWQSHEMVADGRIVEFAKKVHVRSNEDGQVDAANRPKGFRTEVVVTARGTTFTKECHYSWGDPWSEESAMTDDDVRHKFRSFTSGIVRADRAERALEALFALEDIRDISLELLPHLR